jgi:hypothetical protein
MVEATLLSLFTDRLKTELKRQECRFYHISFAACALRALG